MWHAPNQRLRAIANNRKRERERLKKPIHIRRVMIQIEMPGVEGELPLKSEARLVLNDLNGNGLGLFSTQKLIPSQVLKLTITEPIKLEISGTVVWCQEHGTSSHILSSKPYSYRAGLVFIFKTEEQRRMVSEFCDQIHKNYLYSHKMP